MRILYLCGDLGIPVLGRKGASVHVRGLAAALRRAGHAVVLATPLLDPSPWEEPAELDVPRFHLRPGPEAEAAFLALKGYSERLGVETSVPSEVRRILYNQDLERELKRRFERHPPDFVYERASLYTTAGVPLARALNVPLLVELNAPLALEQSAYRGAGLGQLAAQAERWVPSQADAVFAVSAPLRDHVIALGVEPDRVYVLPNAVDPALFQSGAPDPAVRARWGLGEGRDEATGGTRRAERGGSGDGGSVDAHPGAPVLGFVGGLRPWHGVEALPRLLERLIPRYRDLRLVIAGDGPLRGELERDLRERGLAQSAVFTGSLPQEEVATLIRLFDVALAPYPQPRHAFYFSPLKLFEYMACGVPVVAAGLGQIAEVVCDGETGLLYPPGELDALTAACDRLLADPALRRRLGQAAAEAIHGRYTWDVNAARVAERARSLIAARETVR